MFPEYQAYSSAPYQAGIFGSRLATELFGGMISGAGRFGERAYESLTYNLPEVQSIIDYVSGSNQSMTASEMQRNMIGGFTDESGRVVKLKFNANEGMSSVNRSDMRKNHTMSLLATAVQNDKAQARMSNIMEDPRIGGFITKGMIKDILRAGVLDLAGMTDINREDVNQLYSTIDSISLEELKDKVSPFLPPQSTFMIMLNRALGLGGMEYMIGEETATRNIMMRGMMAGGMNGTEAANYASVGLESKQMFANWRTTMDQDVLVKWGGGIAASVVGGYIGGTIGSLFGPGIGTAIGSTIGTIAAPVLFEAAPEIGEAARQGVEAFRTQFTGFVDPEKINKFFSDESMTVTTKQLYAILSMLAEALSRNFMKNLSNEGMKRQIMTVFSAILNSATSIARDKNMKPPIPDGIIQALAQDLVGTYSKEFESKELADYTIKEILRILLSPDATFYADLKAGRENAIQREAQAVLATQLNDIGALFFQNSFMETFGNQLKLSFEKNLTTGTLSGMLVGYSNVADQTAFVRNIEQVKSSITNRLTAEGRDSASIESATSTIEDILKFIDPTRTDAARPSISEDQYKLLESALGKNAVQSLRSILGQDMSDSDAKMRLGRMYRDLIYDPAKNDATERAIKSQMYGEMLIGALRHIKDSNQVDQVKDLLEELGLA
jgi:hypothetical protein